jgi:ABC-2 type transport system permease protein
MALNAERRGPVGGLREALDASDRAVNRTLSFFSKWLAEVLRQPALMVSLVLGPFLLLLAFGEGLKEGQPLPKSVLVTPAGGLEPGMEPVIDEVSKYLRVVGRTADLDAARSSLREGDVELIIVVPPDPAAYVRRREHAPVIILTNQIDPVQQTYARTHIREQIAYLNQQTLNKAIGDAQSSTADTREQVRQAREFVALLRSSQGDVERARSQVRDLRATVDPLASAAREANAAVQGASFVIPGLDGPARQAGDATQAIDRLQRNVAELDRRLNAPGAQGGLPDERELSEVEADLTTLDRTLTEWGTIPSEILSAPFALDLQNVAPIVPDYIDFYAPAVLALLLQHLAITLGALSMARIRLIGLMELLKTSPVRPLEVVTGNYLSYGALCAVAAGLLVGLLTFLLKVPVAGSWAAMLGMLGLLILCSLGIGFIVSMVSSSEQQAAQIAMLILLGSVFFSGFLVSQEAIAFPVSAISYLFPATYAIRSLQDVMLRGVVRERIDLPDLGPVTQYGDYLVLAALSVLFFAVTVYLFRREFRPN